MSLQLCYHSLPGQGGEYSEDDVNELVKEDEVDGEEQTQKTKGKKRKAQSIPARKRKQGGLKMM